MHVKGGAYSVTKAKRKLLTNQCIFYDDVIQTLKTLATEKGTSVSGLVRMIVLEFLAKK